MIEAQPTLPTGPLRSEQPAGVEDRHARADAAEPTARQPGLPIWCAIRAALYVELRDWKDGPAGERLADISA